MSHTADTFPAQATAVNNLNHTVVLLGALPKNGVQNSTKLLKARRFFKPLMKKNVDTNFNIFSFATLLNTNRNNSSQ